MIVSGDMKLVVLQTMNSMSFLPIKPSLFLLNVKNRGVGLSLQKKRRLIILDTISAKAEMVDDMLTKVLYHQ